MLRTRLQQIMLRARLQQITDNRDLSTHRTMLETLRQELPHSIEMLSGPNDDLQYNCVVHAFCVQEDQEYIDLWHACPQHVHGDTTFVQFMIENGDLKEREHPASGLLAYFPEGAFRHIGRLISESRIVSKWGIGHLYEHDIFDVPSCYGEVVRYSRSAERDQVLNRFIEFAEGKGVHFGASDG